MNNLRGSALILALIVATWTAPAALGKTAKKHPSTGVKEHYAVLLPVTTPIKEVPQLAQEIADAHKMKLLTTWEYLRGFHVQGKGQQADAMANDPRIESIEQDVYMSAPVSSSQWTFVPPGYPDPNTYLWYLDRLDEMSWASSTNDGTYDMCPEAGNTTAYMIDMPVWRGHSSVSPRVTLSIDCADNAGCSESRGDPAQNCINSPVFGGSPLYGALNHGTAIASLLTGAFTGAARAEVIALSVYPCSLQPQTQATWMYNAVNWIWGHVSTRRANGVDRLSVVNHSGYVLPWDGYVDTYAQIVRRLVQEVGLPFFTSADNFGTDSCRFSPNKNAFTPINRTWNQTVFVVGHTTMSGSTDVVWQNPTPTRPDDRGSNLGNCVSAFAPGVSIYAAANGGSSGPLDPNYYRVWEPGSSFSSPLVAGLALRWMDRFFQIHGYRPAFTQVYEELLAVGQTRAEVSPAWTAGYTACYSNFDPRVFFTQTDGVCPNNHTAYTFPGIGNTSGARMVFSNLTCP